ncbi:hypothetical protein AB5J56_21645 [Streptomyces sp. R21]|uniref:Uncharacterized protein n=1 Tax=Streptomyces sp. R21 TaxID=3238627 RepID=A0AB39PBJ2_9ACTN
MRRSTPLTRALGSALLACAGTTLLLVYVRYDAPAPRWDMLAAAGAALPLAALWALACRTAPALGRSTNGATVSDAPPRKLPLPKRDRGTVAAAVLLALTPVTLARFAAGAHGSVFGGAVILLVLVVSLKLAGTLRRQTSNATTRRKLRVLAEDAAAGEVHAVRARMGEPVMMRLSEKGSEPGAVSVSYWHWAVLHADGKEIRMSGPRSDVAGAATRFAGQEGWLCLSTRWRLIDDEQPAAFVADSGETWMGLTDPDEVRRHLTSDARATSGALATRPVPRAAKFRPAVHLPVLGGASGAVLLTLPVLLRGEDLPAGLPWLLCALAAVPLYWGVIRGVGDGARQAGQRDVEWTLREETDPSIA